MMPAPDDAIARTARAASDLSERLTALNRRVRQAEGRPLSSATRFALWTMSCQLEQLSMCAGELDALLANSLQDPTGRATADRIARLDEANLEHMRDYPGRAF